MASTVFILNLWCLRTLAYTKGKLQSGQASWLVGDIPAPGGPIKIMRMDWIGFFEVLVGEDPSLCPSLASNCCTRDSSLWIVSRRASTVSSVIGAIGEWKGRERA